MTREEAISVLEDMKVKIDIPKQAVMQNNRNHAIDMAIQALEQQTPKTVNYVAHGYSNGELVYDEAECPNCGNDDFEYGIGNWGCIFCPECGQALKWEDKE